jgi:adenylate cyclase
MDVTVIGDTVNVASRLEALTRNFGVSCLVSQEVSREAEGRGVLSRNVGDIQLKGRTSSTPVYELLWEDDPTKDLKLANATGLESAI